MPFLELEGQPDLENNPRELNGVDVVVGSGSQATWRIARRDLAARHFVITGAQNGNARVLPASVQNVVVLNGRQAASEGTPLRSGDIIAAGSARFIFLSAIDAERPAPAAAPVPAFLVDHKSRKGYALEKRIVQIGREIGCAIVLKDPTISRFHADIRAEGGEFVLYSMGSTGTKINGVPVTAPQMLAEGDKVTIGDTTVTFSRQPLPAGVRSTQFEGHSDDSISRRHTQLLDGPLIIDSRKVRTGRRKALPMPLMIGAAAVVVLVVVALALLR
jgi:predicted component of type VI protein secretion system